MKIYSLDKWLFAIKKLAFTINEQKYNCNQTMKFSLVFFAESNKTQKNTIRRKETVHRPSLLNSTFF